MSALDLLIVDAASVPVPDPGRVIVYVGAGGVLRVKGPDGDVPLTGAKGATGAQGETGQGAKRVSVSEVTLSSPFTSAALLKSAQVKAGEFVVGQTVATLFVAFMTVATTAGVVQVSMRVNGGSWVVIGQANYAAGNGVLTCMDGVLWAAAGGVPVGLMRGAAAGTKPELVASMGTGTVPVTGACTLDFGVSASTATAFVCKAFSGQW